MAGCVVRVLAALAFLAVCVLGSGPASADVWDVLRRSAERMDDIPHEGVQEITVYGPGGTQHSFRQRIYAGGRGRSVVEHTSRGPFNGQRVISDGTRRWRMLPDTGLVFVSAPYDFETERDGRVDLVEHYKDRTRASIDREAQYAGRRVWIVTISRLRHHAPEWVRVRGLAIDQETYLQLANLTYGANGETLSQTQYLEVRYLDDDELDADRFRCEPGPEDLVVPDPARLVRPLFFREAKDQAPWIVPLRSRPLDWRPEGAALPQYGGAVVAQFYYVKEERGERPRPVFLFERRRESRAGHFDEFYGLEQAPETIERRRQAVTWSDSDLVYVLASAIPIEELDRVARAHRGR